MIAVRLQHVSEGAIKVRDIEKVFIGASRPIAITGMLRPALDCDLFGDFQAKAKGRRKPVEELRPVFRRRKLIETEIAADNRERLRVLAQTLVLELLA